MICIHLLYQTPSTPEDKGGKNVKQSEKDKKHMEREKGGGGGCQVSISQA